MGWSKVIYFHSHARDLEGHPAPRLDAARGKNALGIGYADRNGYGQEDGIRGDYYRRIIERYLKQPVKEVSGQFQYPVLEIAHWEYCGMPTIDTLKKWFEGYETKLHTYGYEIVTYKLPEEMVRYGRKQLVFTRAEGEVINRERYPLPDGMTTREARIWAEA